MCLHNSRFSARCWGMRSSTHSQQPDRFVLSSWAIARMRNQGSQFVVRELRVAPAANANSCCTFSFWRFLLERVASFTSFSEFMRFDDAQLADLIAAGEAGRLKEVDIGESDIVVSAVHLCFTNRCGRLD